MRFLSLSLSIAALALIVPRAAEACTGCPSPGYYSGFSGPSDQDTLPANAVFKLSGTGLTFDDLTVTVDGEPASLEEAPDFSSRYTCGDTTAFIVTPAPQDGALVELSGSVCADESTCAVSESWTATAPDLTAPSAPISGLVDIFLPHSEWTCADISETVWFFDLEADFEEPQDARARWRFEVLPTPDSEPSEVFHTARVPDPRHDIMNDIGSVAGSPCFRVSGVDEAGNQSESLTICEPCHFKVDPVDDSPFVEAPDEPVWEDHERVEGGPCDDGMIPKDPDDEGDDEDSGGLDGDGDAASCMVSETAPPPVLALLLTCGLLLRTRRRSETVDDDAAR